MTPDLVVLLNESGVSALNGFSSVATIRDSLQKYVGSLNGAGELDTAAARAAAFRELKAHRVRDGRDIVMAAFAERATRKAPVGANQERTLSLQKVEPAAEPVDGSALLSAVAEWVGGFVYLPRHTVDAITLWTAATWFVDAADFAPLLTLLSATKRCGKSLLLDLVRRLVRLGYPTSGSGVTTAVLFRLNDKVRPTFLIDEAEKLGGKDADKELVGLLNAGYRRGARVQRCIERNGDFEIAEFDAFGFRALAAIKALWDTLTDRSVVVWLERKPAGATVRRFGWRVADAEATPLVRQLARWAKDNEALVAELLPGVARPEWLNDRACDNWATLFAVAEAAGDDWPERALAAARTLEASASAGDPTEILVHDIARLWRAEEWRDVVASGDLVVKLNELETSPWGTYGRSGKGLSTHLLASMVRSLGVRPRQARAAGQGVVRGYWYADLEPVFDRYPLPELVQTPQVVQASGHVAEPVPLVPTVPVVESAQGDAFAFEGEP